MRLAEPAGRLDRVLAGVHLDALAAAPEDENLGVEWAATSMALITFCVAKARMAGSVLVKAPSLKTG